MTEEQRTQGDSWILFSIFDVKDNDFLADAYLMFKDIPPASSKVPETLMDLPLSRYFLPLESNKIISVLRQREDDDIAKEFLRNLDIKAEIKTIKSRSSVNIDIEDEKTSPRKKGFLEFFCRCFASKY